MTIVNPAAKELEKKLFNKASIPQAVTKVSRASESIHEDSSPLGVFSGRNVPGIGDLGKPGDEEYSRLLDKYTTYIWLYIGCSHLADAVNQINFRIIDKRRKGKPDDGVIGTARGLRNLLENPNPHTTMNEFMEQMILHLILTGNIYIEKVLDKQGRVEFLYLLNPKNMVVVPDKKKFIKGYVYTVNSHGIDFKPEDIIHIKLPDPRGESHYGLSRIQAARATFMSEAESINWNLSYFANAAWPSGIIVAAEGMGEEEYKRATKELKQNFSGTSKAGKIMVLEGGVDWKQVSPNPKDLDFLNLRRNARSEILSLLRVPPAIAGVFEFENTTSRSGGVREQSLFLWQYGVMPLVNRILPKLNIGLVNMFSPNYELVPDLSKIPALKETEETKKLKADAFTMLVTGGWPVGRARQQIYPEETPFEHDEALLISGSDSLVFPKDLLKESKGGRPEPQPKEVVPKDDPPKVKPPKKGDKDKEL